MYFDVIVFAAGSWHLRDSLSHLTGCRCEHNKNRPKHGITLLYQVIRQHRVELSAF